MEYSQYSNKIKAGDVMTWNITDIKIDDDFYGEITGIDYPKVEVGSELTLNILKDVADLIIKDDSEYDPNEYFEETLDGVKILFRDHYKTPRIFVETSVYREDGSRSRWSLGTATVIGATKYVFSDNSEKTLVELYKSFNSSSITVKEEGNRIEGTIGDDTIIIDKETGIVIEGSQKISAATGPMSSGWPIQIYFKLIHYEGDANLSAPSTEEGLDFVFVYPWFSVTMTLLLVRKSKYY